MVTWISLTSVLRSARPPNGQRRSTAFDAVPPTTEHLVFFTPHETAKNAIVQGPLRVARPFRQRAPAAHTPASPDIAPQLDAGAAPPIAAKSAAVAEESNALFRYPSPRLAQPLRGEAPWFVAPRQHNPFGRADALTGTERDSILRTLGSDVPELAVNRVQTTSERDARAKEAMLKMRLTGRVLLVPPDNTGGLITSSLPMPLFGRGPSKRQRARERVILDENRARLERLRQRADSVRKSRTDSLPT